MTDHAAFIRAIAAAEDDEEVAEGLREVMKLGK